MKIRYHLIFLLFFTILLSKNSFGWCEDSVRIVVERYCDLCEPRYETIFYYDSIGQLENETYLKWDGIAMVNTGRNLYRVSSDSLIREVEGDEWINGAWKISHLNRTIFNNHASLNNANKIFYFSIIFNEHLLLIDINIITDMYNKIFVY